MKAQFNSIKSSNQSIKILVKISNNYQKNKDDVFKYDNAPIFRYSISKAKFKFLISISPIDSKSYFHKKVIGSFIFDQTIKLNASLIDIECADKDLLDYCVLGFKQKDFIYSIHKKNCLKENFKQLISLIINSRIKYLQLIF